MRRAVPREDVRHLMRDKYGLDLGAPPARDLARLRRGEPLDSVIGWIPFLDCRIDLSRHTFIPRPETEYWTERAIRAMQRTRGSLRVLDLFAGSGCVGIAVLTYLPRAHVDFGDSDPRCHSQILENLRISGIKWKRAQVMRTDVFSRIVGRYDFILANPPYIPRELQNRVASSVLRYEPRRALFGGRDGLTYIRKLITNAPLHLKPSGELWFEFDHRTKRSLEHLLRAQPLPVSLHHDQFGKWRYARVTSH